MITEQEKQLVVRSLEILSEHFETVQILASRYITKEEGTDRIFGSGLL